MAEKCPHCNDQTWKELNFISSISQLLLSGNDIDRLLRQVLQSLCVHHSYKRGMISIFNRKAGSILIKEAFGVSDEEKAKGIYYPGEGITGEVVETGRTILVPLIREDARFLNRTGTLNNLGESSFLCVPIRTGVQIIGTISVVKDYSPDSCLDGDEQLLQILASMIAQTAQHSRSRDEESIQKIQEEYSGCEDPVKHPPNIIGNSKALQPVYQMIQKVAPANSTILILGESGVGKELVAEAIHYASTRAGRAFVKLNCAALPETIIESELFGHEKGAFTGALNPRKGRFELAQEGTLFLDEIGEISPGIQAKLLRVLQEREFERVGGSVTIKVDVRIIAATNKNLEEKVRSGEFREDLFYRLNIIPITVPPLRARPTDILLLSDFFIEKYNHLNGKDVHRISTSAIDMLISYHWPGNVRELENSIERAVILSEDRVIHGYHLPPSLQMADPHLGTREIHGTLQQKLDSIEYEMIVETLKSTRGNLSRAAEQLGLTNRMMGIRARKYNIDFKTFRRNNSFLLADEASCG
ncbi:sigma 54-interacting transcriptional regulator [Oceanispirochaeta crateris]|nr:sigma 54-interacting transcriptional regulator [Oceanispirochaeta crateris]